MKIIIFGKYKEQIARQIAEDKNRTFEVICLNDDDEDPEDYDILIGEGTLIKNKPILDDDVQYILNITRNKKYE